MQNADLTSPSIKGVPGGALHKVVRWAFEKQGLFQPGAVPGGGTVITAEGNPPDVDVYIDDGRNGEYQYLGNHWSCQDMWVRRFADGGSVHQQPVVNTSNYMYVRVKNRGTQPANSVRVDAYHCLPGTGLAFPDDWQPMTTATLSLGTPIAPGGSAIVGPFEFTPTQVGHECLLAIAHADGDPGNDTTLMGTIGENRLVPFDNNIGQRNVNPVPPSFHRLLSWFENHSIWVRNPAHEARKAKIRVQLPPLLRKLGWRMHIVSEGRDVFEIGPRDKREVVFKLEPGKEFRPEDIKRAIARDEATIEIEVTLDDELSGGMSYPISFDAEEDDGGKGKEDDPKQQSPRLSVPRIRTIADLLRLLQEQASGAPKQISADDLRGAKIRRISFDLDDEDDDNDAKG
jgi:hypothetical protein